ncbi:alpha/beta fold hydrolase [Xenorhabdus anantnagensis]|uniref:Alpha/beta hydrolase n=1 Tax=Xenorhabdus anantnagensis TaxID=3025875 RepID=A0ABT5LUV4_9GAMM|nr:alpha/beta hydrolase [Xenorhabdus anantnagensis]MDC9598201.1 alpha/beta hydrolase [Xenorhabdus anantnagensis]
MIDEGTGKIIVMAHGTMMDKTMFLPQIEALKASYRVIAYDQRAHTSAYDTPYNLKNLADDCLTLLDNLKIEKCVLLGMSMGAYMATEFIHHFPDRVEALVMVGSQIGAYSQHEQQIFMQEFIKFNHEGLVLREAQSWLGKQDYTKTARNFDKPVLVIHGEDDKALPAIVKTNAMKNAFPDVEIICIPNARHVVNLEAAEETNKALRHFLERL